MPPNRAAHRAFQSLDTVSTRLTSTVDSHDIGAAARADDSFASGRREPVGAEIGDADFHAEAGKPHRGGKPDAGRAAGDDGDIVGGHGWMGHAILLMCKRRIAGYGDRTGLPCTKQHGRSSSARCSRARPFDDPGANRLHIHIKRIFGAGMNFPSLFSPLKIGPYQLAHRLAMAPLTRMRAEKPSLAPRPLNVEYYAQRATPGGLIIAEASPVTATGFGSPGVPGIYSEPQIKGWREVVDAVHAKGGVIFLQLWHVGRVSHSSFQPGGALPVAPSAVAISAELKTGTADGKVVPYETPRALETGEIPGIVDAYRQGAVNALQAGFDGVEIHGANGYLIEQFLQSHTNLRTDQYGGSIENRVALPDGSDARPWSTSGAPTASACGCRPMASPMAAASPIRCRSTPTRSSRSTRSASPICISSSRAPAAPAGPRSIGRTCRRRWCCSGRSGAAC